MISLPKGIVPLMALCLALVWMPGCAQPKEPDYARPLPPGTWGLRRVTDPARMPDFNQVAFQFYDPDFQRALDGSIAWFAKPSTRYHFPSGPISHTHARASVVAMRELTDQQLSHPAMMGQLAQQFDVWESVGWDGSGQVLFTGYYAPVYRASFTPTPEYRFPIYTRPDDLVSDPVTGQVIGRRVGTTTTAYPTRAQIESGHVLAGHELVYLPTRLDAYAIEVNGSAKLQMTDGSTLYVGYAGTNGHDYQSVGQMLIADGSIAKDQLSMPRVRQYFDEHPAQLDGYIRRNPRMAFFKEYDGGAWPAGSLGVAATAMRTLATDKAIFPRGSVVLVETAVPDTALGSADRPFHQLMLDQDTGGAIRAAGRADIFCGIGPDAEAVAGGLVSTGRMYYLLLKPEYNPEYEALLTPPGSSPRKLPPEVPPGSRPGNSP